MIFIKVFEHDFFLHFSFLQTNAFSNRINWNKIMDAKIFLLYYKKNTTVDKQIVLFNTQQYYILICPDYTFKVETTLR